ncbi:AAA family ATPase [Pseudomaricurvus sp.]|uniref:AAA family ATPase n=1 Tax=Pseudomaricurvus sp. TaxID=2004510 RepID=UPI003F6B3784
MAFIRTLTVMAVCCLIPLLVHSQSAVEPSSSEPAASSVDAPSVSSPPEQAEPSIVPPPESPRVAVIPGCSDELVLLQSLKQDLANLEARQAVYASIYTDQLSSDLTLEEALPEPISEVSLQAWPEEIDCPALQKQYHASRHALIKARERLLRHQKSWAELPEPLRDILLSVWESRQRLLRHDQALLLGLDSATGMAEKVRQNSAAVQLQLSDQRREFFDLLFSSYRQVTPARIADLLALWRGSFELNPSANLPAEEVLDELSAEEEALSRDYFQVANFDAMVQRNAFNDVRAWLWRERHEVFLEVDKRDRKGLLVDEGEAFLNRLSWLIADTRFNYSGDDTGSSRFRGWIKGFAYLLGFLGFFLLVIIAQNLEAPAAKLQSQFAHWSRKRRLASQFSRVTAGLPLLLPWLVGLLGLHLLYQLFTYYHLPLLNSLVPLARLFILYGLIYLAGEWLLQRIIQQAGSFLNEEQLKQVQNHARGAAAVAVLPLLVEDFVELGVGPSKLLDLCHWFSIFGVLLALGLLLRTRRQDFINALKSVLPSRCDNLIETLLGERLFLLVAPVAAPPLLLALLGSFLHQALFDYDWYRKVFARSFKLRAASDASQQEEKSDPVSKEDYERWFLNDVQGQIPFIDSGLYERVRKSLDMWVADKSCENSLLLTGARGSGKSSVLHRLQQNMAEEHPDVAVNVVEVPAKTISEEGVLTLVGEALNTDLEAGPSALVRTDAERQPTLIILDNAQNLFLRRVGGLIGWETLLSLINARVENVFWAVVMNNQSWAYLSNIYGEDYQFRNVKVARPWTQNDVRSLILSRNHLSGYKIRYDEILLTTRGPEAGNIRNAEQLYFSLLWDDCLGNPMLALRLWLTSVRLDGNFAVVGIPEEVSGGWLEQLSNDLHFVYAAIMIHENMTSDELVEATALPERVVRTALKTAYDAGFIQRSENRRYRIVPLWFPTIMKLLARKNLLHE